MEGNDVDVLSNWSQSEKYELLQALRGHGSLEIDQICAIVCSKSREEIEEAIEFYKKIALGQETLKTIKKKAVKDKTTYVPLSSWAKFISDQYNFDDLETETSAVLRLIADFEDRPPANCTEKIDFRKLYNILADALEGKALRDNKFIKAALHACIVETAITSKTFFKNTSYKQVLRSISKRQKLTKSFKRPHHKHEVTFLRHLLEQKAYNPLQIPEHFLKLVVDYDLGTVKTIHNNTK